jgi:hypothetical protein
MAKQHLEVAMCQLKVGRGESMSYAHPRQLVFNSKEGATRCSLCRSAKGIVFDSKGLIEEMIDEPANWVNLKNEFVVEKDRLNRYQRIATVLTN